MTVIQRIVEFLITLPLLPMLLAFSAILRGMNIPGLPDEWSSAVIIAVILIVFGWMQVLSFDAWHGAFAP